VVSFNPYDAAGLGLSSLAALEGRVPAAVGDPMTLDDPVNPTQRT